MIRPIRTYPDSVLAEKCRPVDEVSEDIKNLARDMTETMYEGDGVGLAAPQVGEAVRLITVDPSGPSKRTDLQVLINPEIVEASEETVESEEGCLSVPKFNSHITRSQQVTVRATDIDGNPMEIKADGLLAIILQHEIDHLDGVLILDRSSRLKRSLYNKKVRKWQKQREKDSESSS